MTRVTNTSRRTFIKRSVAGGAAALLVNSVHAGTATPQQTAGPFYPVLAQKDKDFDLTRVEGKQGVAKGMVIIVEGQVVDTDNRPIEDASVDLWQANAAGRYSHPHDTSSAPLDPNFQDWAIVPSGSQGRFRFMTIYPGAYPASSSWTRPPHIHFKISKRGYVELITQMYFPGHELNDLDRLLQRHDKQERELLIASKQPSDQETYIYNIILQKA